MKKQILLGFVLVSSVGGAYGAQAQSSLPESVTYSVYCPQNSKTPCPSCMVNVVTKCRGQDVRKMCQHKGDTWDGWYSITVRKSDGAIMTTGCNYQHARK